MTTPKAITFIVVGTLSLMSILYLGTLAYCVIAGVSPPETLGRSFESAGIYVLGAFTGILVNTRTQHPSEDARSNTNSLAVRAGSDTNATASNSTSDPAAKPNSGSDTITVTASSTSTAEPS